MKTKVLFDYVNRNCGYYRFMVKETEKSFIVVEQTNQSGAHDKEERFRKGEERLAKAINDLVSDGGAEALSLFLHLWKEEEAFDRYCYWKTWKKVF